MVADTLSFERAALASGLSPVAGIDEAGRGPLAGPVVAACVVLSAAAPFKLFVDSKKISPARRQRLLTVLRESGSVWGLGIADHREIDRMNILQATLLAMRRAVDATVSRPGFLLVDGRFPVPVDLPQRTLTRGEDASASIAAASIVAKVTRDEMMAALDREYPVYFFAKNKGYPTREHLEALRRHGPCPLHRRTFRGVLP